ncbi:hypothetical protein O997_00400 [Anaplasma phagocytophilum str. MRK]|nr:hypothetical protein O997_00400 [Anaplasma phagocytophilum str. MRK]
MEISHSSIDGKICKTERGSGSNNPYGKYAGETGTASSRDTALCGGAAGASDSTSSTTQQVLKDFVRETLKDGSKNWPTSSGSKDNARAPKINDNANAVAKDLVALNRDEKTIVAGLLAKTIEGGEVVEIRAVSFYLHLNRSVL